MMGILTNWGSELLVIALSLIGAVVVWFGGAKNERRKRKLKDAENNLLIRQKIDEYAASVSGDTVDERLRKHTKPK